MKQNNIPTIGNLYTKLPNKSSKQDIIGGWFIYKDTPNDFSIDIVGFLSPDDLFVPLQIQTQHPLHKSHVCLQIIKVGTNQSGYIIINTNNNETWCKLVA